MAADGQACVDGAHHKIVAQELIVEEPHHRLGCAARVEQDSGVGCITSFGGREVIEAGDQQLGTDKRGGPIHEGALGPIGR